MGERKALPVSISSTSPVPFYRQIVDQLRILIHSGALEPNARLPSVRELSRDLLVSLITVRRAYADLENEGLVVQKQGQGTFVTKRRGSTAQLIARSEARDHLAEAIRRALQLGMSADEINGLVVRMNTDKGEKR